MEYEFVSSEEFKNIVNFSKGGELTSKAIDYYISILLRNAASRLDVLYTNLESKFMAYNADFFKFKTNYFLNSQFVNVTSKDFEKMCNLIKLPVSKEKIERKNVAMVVTEKSKYYTYEDCINLFNSLSLEEKLKFIKEFSKTTITLTPSEISDLLK